MQLSSAIRAALIVLTVTGAGLTTVYADFGSICFIAVGPGAGGIVLANQNGAVLTLSGRQMGLIVAADLNGLVITLR